MRKLGYFFKEALVNFRRNFSTGIGSTITIFLSLFLIGIFIFASMITQSVVTSVEDKVSITAYVDDSASEADIQSVMDYASGLEYVSNVTFTTKDQAKENFKATTSEDIVNALGDDNPLPASIEIELSDPQQVETVANEIINNETYAKICDTQNGDGTSDPTADVMYGQKSVQRLFNVTNIIRYAGIGAVILLIFVTLVFINNTIRLAIVARRREIAIQRLVGATKGFIRGPFVMEGIIQSVIGVALAVAALAIVRAVLTPYLTGLVSWLPVEISGMQFLAVSLVLLVIGVLIGLFGATLAMRRYLKV